MIDEGARPGAGSRADSILAVARLFFRERRPVLLPRIRLPARPALLVLTMLLLGFLYLALALRSGFSPPPVSEFALLGEESFSNLNSTSAEPPAEVVRLWGGEVVNEAVTTALPHHRTTSPPPEPTTPPAELPRGLAAEESLPILPAAMLEPATESCYRLRDPHPGETPMMRTWKMLGLNTLLAALFAASPGFARDTSALSSDAEKLEGIQKQLNELKDSLTEVKKSLAAVPTLEERIKDVRTDSNVAAQKLQSQIADLNNQFIQLRADLDNLRSRPPSSSRIAASLPSDTGPSGGTARVEMMNTYPQAVSVVLNNQRSYPLQPFERRLSDPIPAGSFTYEILGVTPLVRRAVAADKVFTLWVHPQP